MAIKPASANPGLWHETVGKGPPMALLPGGPGFSHDYLRPHLDPLAEVTNQVWLDLPGTGRSPVGGSATLAGRPSLSQPYIITVIADELEVSFSTIRTYLQKIFSKTDTTSQTGLLRLLTRLGLTVAAGNNDDGHGWTPATSTG